ncbi:MAG: hypothetical protein QGG36_32440 [Pirellulaceae bacterium]|nr:hypothetical protein [Pirellulaceae bacterium]
MANPARALCGLVLILPVVLSSAAHGQPIGTKRDSLQWMVARAEAIVRGPVESVVAINPGDSFTRFFQVTIRSPLRIAGRIEKQVCFVVTDRKPYAELKSKNHEGLFFLARSQFDFQRKSQDHYYSRCPVICKNTIDLDAEPTSVTSFDSTGLRQLVGRQAILAEVERYLRKIQQGERVSRFMLREPDRRAFTGYDSRVAVPLDYDLLNSVAKRWSAAGGAKSRIGGDIRDVFSELIDFEAAKAMLAHREQVPTEWRRASTLSIDSLEWMTADCDVIVRGTIEDLVLVKLGDPDSKKDYESTIDQHLVKLRVSEKIKGQVDSTISFTVGNGGKLSDWKRRKVPLVVFLRDRSLRVRSDPTRLVAAPRNHGAPILRYAARGTDTKAIIAFDKGHPEIFCARLAWITDPHEMLKVVRSYLKQTPSARESRSRSKVSLSFAPPKSFLRGTSWEGDRYSRMKFPIDSYLEQRARLWLKADRKEDRWLGARALVHFKSDENAAALKRLLADPGQWEKPVTVSHFTHQKVLFLVRWEAWVVLNAWGYDVPKPRFSP